MNHIFEGCDENRLVFDWPAFLEMISADGVELFVSELGLASIDDFLRIQELTRACLEAEMFCGLSAASESSTGRLAATEAWRDYRQISGILKDEELLTICSSTQHFDYFLLSVFLRFYERWISQETAMALGCWFVDFFPEAPESVWDWWHILKKVLSHESAFKDLELYEVTVTEIDQIRQLINLVEQEYESMLMRFAHIEQSMKFKPATQWNKLLSAFPVDGVDYYFWLSFVRGCLLRKFLLQAWQNLGQLLGKTQTKSLIKAVKAYAKNKEGFNISPPHLKYH